MTDSTLRDLIRPAGWPRMRPRFSVELSCRADQLMDALRTGALRNEDVIEGRFSERHGVLTVPEDERRFWSTHLSITVEEEGAGPDGAPRSTRVLGVFSPHPEIWTAYVFAIGVLTVIGFFGAMWAVVQLTMGQTPWALLAPLLTGLVGGLVYTSTLVGQGLALGEMYHLRRHLDDCLDDARDRGQREPRTAGESAQL